MMISSSLNHYSIHFSPHHPLPFSSSGPITTTTHSLSFSLRQLYFHHDFYCFLSFSLLCHLHHAAADSTTLRLRSHRLTSGADRFHGWLVSNSQNQSPVRKVSDSIWTIPPPRAAAMAVHRGGRILVEAVVEKVSAAMVMQDHIGVRVFHHTLSSPPWPSISQERQIDCDDYCAGLCCGNTDELAPADADNIFSWGFDSHGPGMIVMSLKKKLKMRNLVLLLVLHLVHDLRRLTLLDTLAMYLSLGDPESGKKILTEGKPHSILCNP